MDVHETELELNVGDCFQVGDYVVTVIDTDGEEISFRVDEADSIDNEDDSEQPEFPPR
ncbi:MAG: hypothetical protein O3A00_07525 [Planctomycetota bacterium]|nr:hypothetical protein [Planctomycetota bacterium]